MNLLTGTVSLIQLDNLYLAISVADTLMIGQSSEVKASQGDKSVGSFEYDGAELPAYYLNDQLIPSEDSSLIQNSQFCIGLRTRQEDDYFVLLCKKFEQIDLTEQAHSMQEIPAFMCNEKMLVEGMLEYQNLVYLVTNPEKIIDYITRHNADRTQENGNA